MGGDWLSLPQEGASILETLGLAFKEACSFSGAPLGLAQPRVTGSGGRSVVIVHLGRWLTGTLPTLLRLIK